MASQQDVFPTSVGMNRNLIGKTQQKQCVPHKRGDEPAALERRASADVCSPQAWG